MQWIITFSISIVLIVLPIFRCSRQIYFVELSFCGNYLFLFRIDCLNQSNFSNFFSVGNIVWFTFCDRFMNEMKRKCIWDICESVSDGSFTFSNLWESVWIVSIALHSFFRNVCDVFLQCDAFRMTMTLASRYFLSSQTKKNENVLTLQNPTTKKTVTINKTPFFISVHLRLENAIHFQFKFQSYCRKTANNVKHRRRTVLLCIHFFCTRRH